ncbi:ATP-binding protein [Bordetella genomosp. 4]|uniref:histidine kinase n=1 Tax=Bordetella genomosp. 4 TaxID=463044 RepID=A0A261TLM8_9BORD|nr:ATP-binding protein [Bordetella genomosp. 4]OZI41955.1 two-component sensor histidine kinase [Bordetella genomosp. 4]OZI49920.1 two-component sensor histidine kinase [Bordetella genomosp. 4]
MKRLRRFFGTMAGRLFLILLLGMSAAALLATVLAEARRQQDEAHQNMVRAADRLHGYVNMLDNSPAELRQRLIELGGPGIHRAPSDVRAEESDTTFAHVLASQYSRFARARVQTADEAACRPRLREFLPQSEGDDNFDPDMPEPTCRIVHIQLQDGTPLVLAMGGPPIMHVKALAADPVYISLLTLCIGLLAFTVARLASRPLRQLADAADELGQNLERPPLVLRGPLEVRRAADAFNAMQRRVQRHLEERTHMLAAITHDLQTPMTRLRLRFEDVTDEALRERLIADLGAMRALVREGLDLARSATTSEAPVALDLDSLLESIIEDAAETGHDAVFEQGCGAVLMLRPLAMQRLFSNLVDNALKYGHQVRVAAHANEHGVAVEVCDAGPGMPADMFEAVFQPFVRLETSRSRETGGVGLGLTIARTLAANDGATVTLSNRAEGGLQATVHWSRPRYADKS